jgi:hypothetical protein
VYLETLRITWTGGGGGPANVTVQESTGDKRVCILLAVYGMRDES